MISIEEKTKRIIEDIQQEKGCNPVRIFKNMAQKEYISIHGPEHHILDGAWIKPTSGVVCGQVWKNRPRERKRPLGWFAPFGSRRIQIIEVEEHEN